MFLLFLLLVGGTLFYLLRTGRISPPWVTAPSSPELEARKVLADRFARGDIDSDEFMERASVLNWTPGVEPEKSKSKRR